MAELIEVLIDRRRSELVVWHELARRLGKPLGWAQDRLAEWWEPEQDIRELRAFLDGRAVETLDERRAIECAIKDLRLFLDVWRELHAEQEQRHQAIVDECDRLVEELEAENLRPGQALVGGIAAGRAGRFLPDP
jgi:hypothetical protein